MDWESMFNDDIDRADRSFRRKRDDDFLLVKARAGFDYKTGEFKLPLGLIEGQRITLALKDLTEKVAGVADFGAGTGLRIYRDVGGGVWQWTTQAPPDGLGLDENSSPGAMGVAELGDSGSRSASEKTAIRDAGGSRGN